MAEVAIPLVGLGLLYIAKKQNGSDDDSNTIVLSLRVELQLQPLLLLYIVDYIIFCFYDI